MNQTKIGICFETNYLDFQYLCRTKFDNMDNLNIKDIIKSDIAVATEAGDKVFNEIVYHLNNNNKISIDFKDISILTTAFLNAAIGQLYSNNKFSSEFLNDYLTLKNVEDEDKPLFAMVIKRAKEYFKDKKGFEDSINHTFHEE